MNSNQKKIAIAALVFTLIAGGIGYYFWKKNNNSVIDPTSPSIDTSALSMHPTQGGVPMLDLSNLPKADSVLVPLLSKTLDDAFAASEKKDYAALASLIVYRGPDSTRMGYDVFKNKSEYEKTIVRVTGETLNKWNKGVQTREYARAFEMPIPDGRSMPVLEVIFIGKKSVDRKFFAFLEIDGQYRISDITSYL